MIYYNKKLKNTARTLRKNMTDAERLLWSRIRRKRLKGFQFYRQKIIGDYIVDFYCPAGKLIIEVDGSQHFEMKGMKEDRLRDEYMDRLGFNVLRLPTSEVLESIDDVVEQVYQVLQESPSPPLRKGESLFL